jgi:2-polyprenyl-3-methyl-5-hydroxy-6-metoxy-1,4-benzoquinol methylase
LDKFKIKRRHMKISLKNKDAKVFVEALPSGKNKISIELLNNDQFIPQNTCETKYPIDLIEKILDTKGPNRLCDEILRDESPDYVQKNLQFDILGYFDEEEFANKRLLDFGCGCGASTMILARMFPKTEIVGIELEERLLNVAKARANYYGYEKLELIISPNADKLPSGLGYFDSIVLSAVYEHLLPRERELLLPEIWSILKPGGILLINQTPHRYFPVELHTTSGLPLINYMPDRVAYYYAQYFSRRKLKNNSWEMLLRRGIRGGSVKEIMRILNKCPGIPILLDPSKYGTNNRIDLWYVKSSKSAIIKKSFRFTTNLIKLLTGKFILPSLALAIKKNKYNI